MGLTPPSDRKALHPCLGKPGPTSVFPATRPRWPGSPTYSWGSGIAPESSGPHVFCKGSASKPVPQPAAKRLGDNTCDRLCLASALQGSSCGLVAGRSDELKAGGMGPPSALTSLPGPYFLSTLTEGAAITECTLPRPTLSHLLLLGMWQELVTG